MGDNDKDKVAFKTPDDVGPFRVRAFITRDDTKPPGEFGGNTVPFSSIYQNSPGEARYAVLSYKGRIVVVDIYESRVMSDPPRVVPDWIRQNFKDANHAIAAMRISYSDGPHHSLLSGRDRLSKYEGEEFDRAFDRFAK